MLGEESLVVSVLCLSHMEPECWCWDPGQDIELVQHCAANRLTVLLLYNIFFTNYTSLPSPRYQLEPIQAVNISIRTKTKSKTEAVNPIMVNTSIISNFDHLSKLVRDHRITGIYIILGNGRGPQYRDMFQVRCSLRPVMAKINAEHGGGGNWMAVYCGIPYSEQSSDIATCLSHIKEEFNPFILSVQPRWTKDNFVDFIYKYDVLRDQYGGLVRELEVCGEKTHYWNFLAVLSTYIGPEFLGLINAVININSQGPIGVMELNSAREANLEIIEVTPADPMRDASNWKIFDGKLGYEEGDENIWSESSEPDSATTDEDHTWRDYDNFALLDNRKRKISEDSDSEEENSSDSDYIWRDYDNFALLDNRRKKRKIL